MRALYEVMTDETTDGARDDARGARWVSNGREPDVIADVCPVALPRADCREIQRSRIRFIQLFGVGAIAHSTAPWSVRGAGVLTDEQR